MMNLDDTVHKIVSLLRRLFPQSGSFSPRRIFYPESDCNIALVSSFLALIVLVGFGAYLFLEVSREKPVEIPGGEARAGKLDRQLLQSTIEAYRQKEANLEALKNGLPVTFPADPSL